MRVADATHLVNDEVSGGGRRVILSDGATCESSHDEKRSRGTDHHTGGHFIYLLIFLTTIG